MSYVPRRDQAANSLYNHANALKLSLQISTGLPKGGTSCNKLRTSVNSRPGQTWTCPPSLGLRSHPTSLYWLCAPFGNERLWAQSSALLHSAWSIQWRDHTSRSTNAQYTWVAAATFEWLPAWVDGAHLCETSPYVVTDGRINYRVSPGHKWATIHHRGSARQLSEFHSEPVW